MKHYSGKYDAMLSFRGGILSGMNLGKRCVGVDNIFMRK
jgi:hypothetical protein